MQKILVLCPYLFGGSGLAFLMPSDSWRSHYWSVSVLVWGSWLLFLLFLQSLFVHFSTHFCFWRTLLQFRLCTCILIFILLICNNKNIQLFAAKANTEYILMNNNVIVTCSAFSLCVTCSCCLRFRRRWNRCNIIKCTTLHIIHGIMTLLIHIAK